MKIAKYVIIHFKVTPTTPLFGTTEQDNKKKSILPLIIIIFILLFIIIIFLIKHGFGKQNSAINLKCFSCFNSNTLNQTQNILIQEQNISFLNPNLMSKDGVLNFNNFKKEKCIGRGGFGTVNICTIAPSHDRKFAVKHLDILPNNEVKIHFRHNHFIFCKLNVI